MQTRAFGASGLTVPVLGFGAGHVGGDDLSEEEVGRLLGAVLDLGLTLLDTAPSYGRSEERIGRHLAHRRGDFVLSTKVGYGVPGVADWTYEAVAGGVDLALSRLRSEVIDVVHLHSCPLEVLRRGDVIDALAAAVDAGKVRVAAYSGENEALAFAVGDGRFGAVQTSLNPFDQGDAGTGGANKGDAVERARQRGLGVIAKRPLGNAVWRFGDRPPAAETAPDLAEYHRRWRAMAVDPLTEHGLPWPEVALRFAAHHCGADACLVGTTDLGHLRANAEAVAAGPLPEDLVARLRGAFRDAAEREGGAGWGGVV